MHDQSVSTLTWTVDALQALEGSINLCVSVTQAVAQCGCTPTGEVSGLEYLECLSDALHLLSLLDSVDPFLQYFAHNVMNDNGHLSRCAHSFFLHCQGYCSGSPFSHLFS